MNRNISKNWIKNISITLVFCSALALLTACAPVGKATYPPNFVYLDNARVHSAMQSMAISIDTLDKLLRQSTIDPQEKNRMVIEELNKLKETTDGLGANAPISSHRVISDNMGSFRARLAEAKTAASSDNPDYSLSGRLSTECLSCHVKNLNDTSFF